MHSLYKLNKWEAVNHNLRFLVCTVVFSAGTTVRDVGYIGVIPAGIIGTVITAHGQHLIVFRISFPLYHYFLKMRAAGEYVEEELLREEKLGIRPQRLSLAMGKPFTRITELPDDNLHLDEDSFPQANYPYVVDFIFKRGNPVFRRSTDIMRCIVNVCICLIHMGIITLLIKFIGLNLERTLAKNGINIKNQLIMFASAFPIWGLSLIPNLKMLTPVNAVGNALMLIVLVVSAVHLVIDIPLFSERKAINAVIYYPEFFHGLLRALESSALVLPMRISLKFPAQAGGLFGYINISSLINSVVFLIIGVLEYLNYGSGVKHGVFLCIPDSIFLDIIVGIVCVVFVLSIPIQIFTLLPILWPPIKMAKGPFHRPFLAECIFRTCLVVIALIAAIGVPYVDVFVSLMASLSSPAISLYIPALMDIIRRFDDSERMYRLIIAKNLFMIGAGILIFVVGIYDCAEGAYNIQFHHKDKDHVIF